MVYFGIIVYLSHRLGAHLVIFLVGCVRRTTTCNDRPCFEGVQCIDTPSGFQCGECPPGMRGDGQSCVDINEVRLLMTALFRKFWLDQGPFCLATNTYVCFGLGMTLPLAHNDPQSRLVLPGPNVELGISRLQYENDTTVPARLK